MFYVKWVTKGQIKNQMPKIQCTKKYLSCCLHFDKLHKFLHFEFFLSWSTWIVFFAIFFNAPEHREPHNIFSWWSVFISKVRVCGESFGMLTLNCSLIKLSHTGVLDIFETVNTTRSAFLKAYKHSWNVFTVLSVASYHAVLHVFVRMWIF